MFIVFEGIDGSGKTTQLFKLYAALDDHDVEAIWLCEPGTTVLGQAVRGLLEHTDRRLISPVTQLFLYCAARSQLVDEVLRPCLDDNVILCDRWSPSTFAYQVYGGGASLGDVFTLDTIARQNVEPDLIFYFDLSVDKALERSQARDGVDPGPDAHAFLTRVLDGYHRIAPLYGDRWHTIDATLPIDSIHQTILSTVLSVLSPKELGCCSNPSSPTSVPESPYS